MPKRPEQRNIIVPEQQWEQLGKIAEATGRGRSELIREAIDHYLGRRAVAITEALERTEPLTCATCGHRQWNTLECTNCGDRPFIPKV
jgi:predicted DNA-binding protein